MRGDQGSRTLVGIDWGTSNRRAYVLDGEGVCLRRHEDAQGVLTVRERLDGRFDESLRTLLGELQAGPEAVVLMSGMVGGALGWQEVPYLDCLVPLDGLRAAAVAVRGAPAGRDWRIVPGYCCRHGDIDVMRGEETQLLGVAALGHGDGWVVLPGTHSKWVLLCHGRVVKLATYMTGELFGMLAAGGTLAPLMSGGEDRAALRAGALRAQRREPLSHALFGVRACVMAGAMPAAHARSFISGLLIGAEFAAAQAAGEGRGVAAGRDAPPEAGAVRLIASPALNELYAEVAEMYNVRVIMLEPDVVYCAALAQFLPGG